MALAGIGGKYGYIGIDGKYKIIPEYDNAGKFSGGLAYVEKDDKYGFIDKDNQFVIEPKYDYALSFINDLALVWERGTPKYINRKGRVIFVFED
ncbi:MAG: WG repeat-containing protein [Ignavibacteriae bacterium]|nr:WG repeat-containing protein [Ignavibacteriota bacterium]